LALSHVGISYTIENRYNNIKSIEMGVPGARGYESGTRKRARPSATTLCGALVTVAALIGAFPDSNSERLVAQAVAERLNQQIIIENRGGAGTNISTSLVAHAAPY
jgi:hypothetical protein